MKNKELLQEILTDYCFILHWLEVNSFDLSMADFLTTKQVVELSEKHGKLDQFCDENDITLG